MAEEDKIIIEDESIALNDLEAVEDDILEDDTSDIIDHVMAKYRRAETQRKQDEDRWLRAYRNYRGLYGPDVQFTEA